MSMNQENLSNKRHSLAHLLAAAVMQLYPDSKRTIGPAIDDGFYFDFEFSKPIVESDLEKIEAKMREILPTWSTFERSELTADEAKAEYPGNQYKHGLIDEFTKDGEKVSFYKSGDYWDLCRGGHVNNMSEIDPQSFKLNRLAGAYWRGDENNKMLTRIYGLAFDTKEELKAHIKTLELAKLNDHRKLGQELDLFTFSDLVGAGLPLFTPKGTVIRTEIQNYLLEISRKFKMLPVTIPHIAKIDLYETSGHAAKFGDELFKVTSHYNQEFVMKPVNCPHHTQIYASRPRSYRDLPLRYMESTMQYRDEKPGEIGGLTRVRAITVDDGHIFCRVDQIKEEAKNIGLIIQKFYSSLGMYGNHWVSLSLRDSEHPENYIGDDEDWKQAEQMLQEVSDELNLDAKRMEGEAAIYGPKLDYMFKDSTGKERQLATIQIDFAMPKRFKLTYTDNEGKDTNPVIIHRAILGSYERFLSILIEHFGGAFPLWLSPVQVMVLPISDKHIDYANRFIEKALEQNPNARIEIDDRSESVGKKIREAATQKIPYLLVVGDKEIEANSVAVRARGDQDLGVMKAEEFIKKLNDEITNKK